jgi:2-oxoisovalerate dehydrogenase E1 component
MRDGGYRTMEEIESWKSRDPISLLESRLLDREIATQAQIDAVREEIEDVVAEGLEFARTSPYPEPDTAALHIYGKN